MGFGDQTKIQFDAVKSQHSRLMADMEEVGKMHAQHLNGQKVDMKKLKEIISDIESLANDLKNAPGGFMLKGALTPIERKMHGWVSDIEKRQKELGYYKEETETTTGNLSNELPK